jgi:hypothetical protein
LLDAQPRSLFLCQRALATHQRFRLDVIRPYAQPARIAACRGCSGDRNTPAVRFTRKRPPIPRQNGTKASTMSRRGVNRSARIETSITRTVRPPTRNENRREYCHCKAGLRFAFDVCPFTARRHPAQQVAKCKPETARVSTGRRVVGVKGVRDNFGELEIVTNNGLQ